MNTIFVPNDWKRANVSHIDWLNQNVGEQPEEWWWWEGHSGFFIGFKDPQDAVAFRLKFGL